MTDIARLLAAAHLGLCATTTLLLVSLALAAPHPRRVPAAAALLLGSVINIVASVLRAESRAATALDGLALVLVVLAGMSVPAVRAAVRSAPIGALAALGVLRLVGADALLAARGGWLPAGAARVLAGIEVAAGLCAVVAAMLLRRRPRAGAALLTLSVLGAGASVAVVHRGVRPLPAFAALYTGPFLSLCVAAALVAAWSALPAGGGRAG